MSTEYKPPVRKATFTVEKVKGKRVFHAVNKRAHKLAKRVGKRSKLSAAELKKALASWPSTRAFAYNGDGKLVRLSVK